MSEPPVPGPPIVLIALTRPLLAQVLGPDRPRDRVALLGRRLDAAAHAVILGSDLLEQSSAGSRVEAGLDQSVAAITLAAHTHRVGLVIAAAAGRDHPYNLARRVAGVDHATGGRAGLAIAAADHAATAGNPWTRADQGVAAADAVTAIRDLWRSYPADAIIADPNTGVFAESDRIVAIDHRGAYDIAGPFQVPSSPQVWPPVFVSAAAATESTTRELAAIADVVVPVNTGGDGIVVHPPGRPSELDELLAGLPAIAEHTTEPVSLRAALGLALPDPRPVGRSVFPTATSPEVSRA